MNRNRKKNKNKGQKPLKELTIKDNFMFGATMVKPENCKGLLEMTLQIPIARVEINIEKTMIYNPEYKGVRLDVYAKDEKNTHYNVEMQAVRKLALGNVLDITTVKLIWRCWIEVMIMKNYRILM